MEPNFSKVLRAYFRLKKDESFEYAGIFTEESFINVVSNINKFMNKNYFILGSYIFKYLNNTQKIDFINYMIVNNINIIDWMKNKYKIDLKNMCKNIKTISESLNIENYIMKDMIQESIKHIVKKECSLSKQDKTFIFKYLMKNI